MYLDCLRSGALGSLSKVQSQLGKIFFLTISTMANIFYFMKKTSISTNNKRCIWSAKVWSIGITVQGSISARKTLFHTNSAMAKNFYFMRKTSIPKNYKRYIWIVQGLEHWDHCPRSNLESKNTFLILIRSWPTTFI